MCTTDALGNFEWQFTYMLRHHEGIYSCVHDRLTWELKSSSLELARTRLTDILEPTTPHAHSKESIAKEHIYE